MFSLLGKIFFLSVCRAEPESVYSADRIVVVIQERVITKSDVLLELELQKLIPTTSQTLHYYRMQDPVEALIQLHLLKYFAGDIGLYKTDKTEVQRRYELFRMQWDEIQEYNNFLLLHGLNEQRILSFLRTLIVAENYIERNLGIAHTSPIEKTQEEYETWIRQARNSTQIRYVKERPLSK